MVAGYNKDTPAQVAELVDAHGLEPCGAIRGGSSPLLGTNELGSASRCRQLVEDGNSLFVLLLRNQCLCLIEL